MLHFKNKKIKNEFFKIKHWFTLNEPYSFCVQGYGLGKEAPLIYSPGVGIYLCAHHVTLAHARAYRLYKREFYHFKGKVGPVLNFYYYWPKDPTKQEDIDSAERAITFFVSFNNFNIFASVTKFLYSIEWMVW